VVLLLLFVGLVAHLVFRRPWEVEASCDQQRLTWLAGGWRRSQRRITEVQASLRSGRVPAEARTE
jgi:hypothetical protein